MNSQTSSTLVFNNVMPDGTKENETANSNVLDNILLPDLILSTKASNKTFLKEGEQAIQTIVITNNALLPMQNVTFKDVMSEGAEYVVGSVKINGVVQADFDPAAGFTLADIAGNGGKTTVEYTIVSKDPAVATAVTNTAEIKYGILDPLAGILNFTNETNAISIELVTVKLTIVAAVNQIYATKGDTLHFITTITNTGTVSKSDLNFSQSVGNGTTFVGGSVKINNVAFAEFDPSTGFALDNMNPQDITVVEFDTIVD